MVYLLNRKKLKKFYEREILPHLTKKQIKEIKKMAKELSKQEVKDEG